MPKMVVTVAPSHDGNWSSTAPARKVASVPSAAGGAPLPKESECLSMRRGRQDDQPQSGDPADGEDEGDRRVQDVGDEGDEHLREIHGAPPPPAAMPATSGDAVKVTASSVPRGDGDGHRPGRVLGEHGRRRASGGGDALVEALPGRRLVDALDDHAALDVDRRGRPRDRSGPAFDEGDRRGHDDALEPVAVDIALDGEAGAVETDGPSVDRDRDAIHLDAGEVERKRLADPGERS